MICGVSLLGTFINYFGSFRLCSENMARGVVDSVVLVVIQVVGCFLGLLLYIYKGFGRLPVWESLLWGSDCLVGYVYRVYLRLSGCCVLSFYRWEIYLASLFGLDKDN